jgi:hypothetical protein
MKNSVDADVDSTIINNLNKSIKDKWPQMVGLMKLLILDLFNKNNAY